MEEYNVESEIINAYSYLIFLKNERYNFIKNINIINFIKFI